MKRYPYKTLDRYYNQTSTLGVPICCFRRSVMPGQTVSLDAEMEFRSSAWPVSMNKLVNTVSYFYVPYRLLWDGWVNYITDGTGTLPTDATLQPIVFDTEGTSTVFARRAYKLIYNQFFGDENSVTGLYNIINDAETLNHAVLQLEQRLRDLLLASQFQTDTYDATVVGAVATTDLQEFSRAAAAARRNFSFDSSGDKYNDFLKKFGARPTFNEQIAPEYLGGITKDVAPRTQAATDGANLGALRTYYSDRIRSGFGKKSFNEHGIILGIQYSRPVMFRNTMTAVDVDMKNLDDYFRGDNVNRKTNFDKFGGTAADIIEPPSYNYTQGQHVMNNNGQADMVLTSANETVDVRYAPVTITPSEATLGTDAYAIHNECRITGASPASTKLVY